MKRCSHARIRCCVVGCSLLAATSLKAGLEGPYTVTPPEPGDYEVSQQSPNYGQWTAAGGVGRVNTSNAPARLVLEVPAHSIIANGITFSTHAIADGTVTFDYTTSSIGGHVSWLHRPAGTNRTTYVVLDDGAPGPLRHFTFQVQAGDWLGFSLSSGGDAIFPDDPLKHTLAVENFSGPIPQPILAMPAAGILHWHGVSNVVYTVQVKTNLNSTDWLPLGTATSIDTNFWFIQPKRDDPHLFYRVVYP